MLFDPAPDPRARDVRLVEAPVAGVQDYDSVVMKRSFGFGVHDKSDIVSLVGHSLSFLFENRLMLRRLSLTSRHIEGRRRNGGLITTPVSGNIFQRDIG